MRVLLVEDELKVVNYLRDGLSGQGWLVDVAMDGEEGVFKASEYEFDVIILDVNLPKKDGLSVLRELRENRQTPVVMLTARDRVDDRVQAFRAGADDYVTKPFSFLELVERLHAITRRVRSQPTMVLQVGNLNVDLISRRAGRNGVRLELTAKEFKLLSALARHRGKILSKTQIAELVWDVNFDSNTNVVEAAVKRLRAKLDDPFESKLLHTIRGMGYVLEERESQLRMKSPSI
jgi:two-component system, OmpR family, copper resistance phosphate regulon response regulator CusR